MNDTPSLIIGRWSIALVGVGAPATVEVDWIFVGLVALGLIGLAFAYWISRQETK
jgi:hypothetical protein